MTKPNYFPTGVEIPVSTLQVGQVFVDPYSHDRKPHAVTVTERFPERRKHPVTGKVYSIPQPHITVCHDAANVHIQTSSGYWCVPAAVRVELLECLDA